MTDTTFVAKQTKITADWANDVNDVTYTDCGGVGGLSSTAVGKGASLVGLQDAAGDWTATNVEALSAEVADKLNGTLPITPDINGGTIDGVVIGGSSPTAGSFTTLTHNFIGFEATQTVAQTLSATTWTKLTIATEIIDSNSWYDSVTNYRFTPLKAGKYIITGGVAFAKGGAGEVTIVSVYKNGSEVRKLGQQSSVGTETIQLSGSCILSLNGSTDYIELWAYVSAGDDTVPGAGQNIHFSACYMGA